MAAPRELDRLIENFDRNIDEYHRGRYNETMLRRDFLDRLIKMLGWDVDNDQGLNELQREVVHEDALKIEGKIKAPDYSIRVNGQRRFFIEAKKPSVNIKDDIAPSFQLRRYAWSAKLPLSLLTDFEEFAVYDTRIRPDRLDRASVARTIYFRYTELSEKWDEFAGIFSKDAVLGGSFDHFAVVTKSKKGTAQVDDEFLVEIDGWREMLAQNLALRNKELTQRDLNFSVQKIIDRIIFLRICEDRGIEEYGRLRELKAGSDVYRRLLKLFDQADARYNSGLFHFRNEKSQAEGPDRLTPTLAIDDQPLQEICRRLYYPDSPYEFSVISGTILGQVYERFLGKVIVLDQKHRATVEVKPEVRKAGGVYYTPDYITRFIVEQTVGKMVEGLDAKAVAPLRVLDPACGSGSFLLAAFDYLLEWHLRHYASDQPDKLARKKTPPIYALTASDGSRVWRLTTAEKRRILINNIYGVDIDGQAVEVTKLSLLLKVLEGESAQTLGAQLSLLHERVLPDLGGNIKSGNALVDDGWLQDLSPVAPDESVLDVNPFSWRHEFPAVMANGGFDVVLGNPPYHSVKLMDAGLKAYFGSTFQSAKNRFNLYGLFIERSLSLVRNGGRLGFIVPSSLLANSQYTALRSLVLDGYALDRVVDVGGGVFQDATVETVIIVGTRIPDARTLSRHKVSIGSVEERTVKALTGNSQLIAQQTFRDDPHRVITIRQETVLLERDGVPLGKLCEIKNGINPGNIADRIVVAKRLNAHCKPLIDGKDVQRYEPPRWRGSYVRYDEAYVEVLRREWKEDGKDWTARIIKKENYFEREKLLVQRIRNLSLKRRLVLTYDDQGYYTSINVGVILQPEASTVELKYILGLLNSKYVNWWYSRRFRNIQIKNAFLEQVPIIVPTTPTQKQMHDNIVAQVAELLRQHSLLDDAKTGHEHTRLKRRIGDLEARIDESVFDLYNVSKDERAQVESYYLSEPVIEGSIG